MKKDKSINDQFDLVSHALGPSDVAEEPKDLTTHLVCFQRITAELEGTTLVLSTILKDSKDEE